MNSTAIHEAAHAVAHVVLDYPLHECTITSNVPGKAGHTHGDVLPKSLTQSGNWAGRQLDDDEMKRVSDDVVILLIGEVAEAKLHGTDYAPEFDSPRNSDEHEAFGRITAMRPADYDGQNQLLEELLGSAMAIANQRWADIRNVAALLSADGSVTGDQVRAAMTGPSG